ncbi:MAG: ATP-dependent acyl-CoA ligase [Gammaproteobacteria bacterium]|nr:ATP-dependent acyl-CoA ligase [Gammaproteobacteria bacterium]
MALGLDNRPEFFLHWLALNSLGISVVPLNPQWQSAELEYVLTHSEVRYAVVLEDRLGNNKTNGDINKIIEKMQRNCARDTESYLEERTS